MAIDVNKTRWAVYRKSTKTVLDRNKIWPVHNGGPIVDPDPDYVWLLHVEEDFPDYDHFTQRVVRTEKTDLRSKTINTQWSLVDLTEDEKEAILPEYFKTSGGIKLKVDDDSQNAFTRMVAMIDLAGMTGSTKVNIKDVYGIIHELTVSNLKESLQEYGAYCYTRFLSQ